MALVTKVLGAALLVGAMLVGQQSYPPANVPGAAGVPGPMGAPGPMGDQGEAADQQHSVARVSFLGGNVNLQRGGTSELVAAVVNAPLMAHDRLQTGPGSSAEVQLDGLTLVRLAENSDVGFGDLQAGRALMQFGAGTIIFRVLRETQLQTDLETPSVAVHPLGTADLRISVLENGLTQIAVRAGAADIYGPGGTQRLEAGRAVLVRGNAGGPEFQDVAPPARDGLDDWSAERDNQLLASQSYQYTGGDMAGVADLDANGSWVSSQYGPVWAPQAADPNWAPYSNGQWVDEPYYGWTWVDAEPWGWAPFHYGRWFLNGGRGWCWWPGAIGYRHVWGPAYVGFFGFGVGRGLGWVALAPFEGFHSWWGGGAFRGYGGFYGGGAGVFGSYRNAAFRGAAVGANFGAFGSFRGRFNAVGRESISSGTVIRGQLPVSGAGYRFHFVNSPAIANPRLASVGSRGFFQSPHYQASGLGGGASRFGSASHFGGASGVGSTSGAGFGGYRGNPGGGQNQYRGAGQPSSQYRPPVAGSRPGGGWQQFGNPSTLSGNRQSFAGSSNESGWHQFGQPQGSRSLNQPTYRNYGGSQPAYRSAPSYRQETPSYHSSTPYRAPAYRAQSSPAPRSFSGGGGGSHGGGGSSHSEGSHGGGGGGGHHR